MTELAFSKVAGFHHQILVKVNSTTRFLSKEFDKSITDHYFSKEKNWQIPEGFISLAN